MTSSFDPNAARRLPFVVVIDNQEKAPLPFPPTVTTIRADLKQGDYSVAGLEGAVAIERKSPEDFVGTLFGSYRDAYGRKRQRVERFAWELQRLEGYRHVIVAITGDRAAVAKAAIAHADAVEAWTGKRYPRNADEVWNLAASLSAEFAIPFVMFSGETESAYFAERLLRAWWKEANGYSHVRKYRATFAESGKARFGAALTSPLKNGGVS